MLTILPFHIQMGLDEAIEDMFIMNVLDLFVIDLCVLAKTFSLPPDQAAIFIRHITS